MDIMMDFLEEIENLPCLVQEISLTVPSFGVPINKFIRPCKKSQNMAKNKVLPEFYFFFLWYTLLYLLSLKVIRKIIDITYI